ncbi:MAG: PEP-CTERM sorting domain-containing protein, partial [Synechococcales bacterium]|nr:PEP-CTERM sorting domain-containing protein [Synechococcales bacterium]
NFLGGNANGALSEGQTTTASIKLSLAEAKNAQQIEEAFFAALSQNVLNVGVRFQQVNAGAGSDKLSGGTIQGASNNDNDEDKSVEVPEPGSLLGMGLLAGVMATVRKRFTVDC